MVFWKKEELPPELQGMDPKDVVAKLKELDTTKTELATVKQQAADQSVELTRVKEEHTTLSTKVADMEAKLNTPPPPKREEDEPPSIFTDPAKFVEQQTQGTKTVALVAGIMSAKMYAVGQLPPRDQKIFRKYEGDIEKIVNSYPPEQRVNPMTWMNALIYIKGLKENDIKTAETENPGSFSEVPSRTEPITPTPSDKLTEEEEALCKAMRWDPKKYLESKKGAVQSGTHITYGGVSANG